ncbi:MAG: hypothetical protein LBK41_05520 [Clostridiales bacterium]|jgi:uncharacterized membrane protein YkvI|nr:hypothetical protein [Clostridiales bacterium]
MNDVKNALNAAGIYTAVVLGAGFASGQEIIRFFVRHGDAGYVGLSVAGVVFALSGWAVLDISARLRLDGWDGFARAVFGERLGKAVSAASTLFIGVLFCAMLAGAGAMGREAFGLPFSVGVLALAAVCFVIFLTGARGLLALNAFLAPILMAGGVFFGLYAFFTDAQPAFAGVRSAIGGDWVYSALTYASYNVVTAITVLSGMRGMVNNRKTAKLAGLCGGLFLTALGFCFALPLYLNAGLYERVEIPMMLIARRHGRLIEGVYVFVLVAAIMTSAVANGFAVVDWICARWGAKKTAVKLGVTLVCAAAAHTGFSELVGRVYPLFGLLGMFEVAAVILYFIFGEKSGSPALRPVPRLPRTADSSPARTTR